MSSNGTVTVFKENSLRRENKRKEKALTDRLVIWTSPAPVLLSNDISFIRSLDFSQSTSTEKFFWFVCIRKF